MLEPRSLAFSADEAVKLLRDRVDEKAARRLHAQCDGWAAGLLLAQRALPSLRDDTQVRDRLDTYFIDHVLAAHDSGERTMLAAVSLLPQIDVHALEKMGFDASAAATLDQLHRAHSFVTRLDRQPPSWRLHDLLRDALRSRFDSFGDVEWRRATRVAAAQIAAEQWFVRDAVQLYVDAGDVRAATILAERFARHAVKLQRLAELDAIAAALGDPITEASLPIQVALGESAWQRSDAKAAVARFERAIALVDQGAPSPTGLLIAASALGAIFNGWQDFGGTTTWKARLAFHLPARDAIEDPNEDLRIDSVCLRSSDMLLDATLIERSALAERILAALRLHSDALIAEEALAASEIVIETAGYHLSDERLFTNAVEASAPWLSKPNLAPLALAGWLVAYAPLGRRWPTPAIKLPAQTPVGCLELALAIARECGGQSKAFSAALFLANLATADNDRTAAQKHLASLREIFDPSEPTQRVNFMLVEGGVLALSGEWTRARVTDERALDVARKHDFPLSEQWSVMLALARIEIAAGDPQKAHDALLRTAAQFEGMRRDFALILADVASAAHAWRVDGAVPPDLTRSIVRRASEYAWPGFGTGLAPIAARLCSDALKLGIEPEFVRHVIRERRLSPPTADDPHWPWPIRVHALGGLRVEVDREPLAFGSRAQRRPLDLLKVIVAHGPAPVDAATVLDALWPDADGATARAAFDMAVMRLRKLLRREDAVKLDAGRIELDPSIVWVDAFAFGRGAIDDYSGPLFGPDAVAPWWAAARERLHQRFLRRTVERGALHEQQGRIDAALAVYEAGLAQDTLAEELYRGAIRCHLAAGRAADALRVYRRCRDQLSIVLSVAPSAATTALVAPISAR